MSQHGSDDEGEGIDDEDNSNLDEEERYKSAMERPLFNTDEDEEDPYNDEEAKRKGVHWGEDVADRTRGDGGSKNVSFGNPNNQ